MEAATVARRPAASAAPAVAPAPAQPKRRPRGRPEPGKRTSTRRTTALKRAAPAKRTATPKRKAPAKRAPAKRATGRKRVAAAAAPARTKRAPARTKRAPAVGRPHLIPIAVGTATLVKELPDSSLIVRLTRGRAWIGLLGVLLVGIVGLNVFTLSISATAGAVDENIAALEEDNGLQRSRDATLSGSAHVRDQAAGLGLAMADVDAAKTIQSGGDDLKVAVERLAAAGNGY